MFQNLKLSRPLAVFDLETTGTSVEKDRIVEICVVKIHPDKEPERGTRRLNPGIPIPPEATEVHKITDADVADKPRFSDVATRLRAFLDNCDFCGFNISKFDLPLLVAEFNRCNTPLNLEGRSIIDPMSIFHFFEKRNLEAAVEFYLNRKHENAHSAEVDVNATIEVLDAMTKKYTELPKSPLEIALFLKPKDAIDLDGKFSGRGGVVHFTFGKFRGVSLEEVAKNHSEYIRDFLLKGSFSEDTKRVAREALVRAGNAG